MFLEVETRGSRSGSSTLAHRDPHGIHLWLNLVMRPETPPLCTPEGGERRTRVFYSESGWDPFLQSELATAGHSSPTPAAHMGGRRFPPSS